MNAKPAPLPAAEWDFTAVPESELVACYLWEFARESQAVRDWFAARVKSKTYGLTIAAAYDLLLKEAATKPGTLREAMHVLHAREGLGAIRVPDWMRAASEHPGASRVLRHFPGPWQSLSEKDRKRFGACVFKRHNVSGTATNSVLRSQHETDGVGTLGHEGLASLRIDWRADDASLVQAFRAWLRANRPQGQRATKPGHWPRRFKMELSALGSARLLRYYGARDAGPLLAAHFPKSEPLADALSDESRAGVERHAARRAFHGFFPKEKPLFDRRKP